MASRENQPLHVALILLVIVTVLLCVMTYWFYSKSVAGENRADAAQEQLATTKQDLQKALFKVQTFTYMVRGGAKTLKQIEDDFANITGTARDEELDQMIKKFEDNMLLFGPADQEYKAERNYQSLPEFLLSRIRDLNKQLVGLRQSEAQLTAQMNKLKQDEAARTKQFEDLQKKAHDDLVAERDQFNQKRAELSKQNQQLAGLIASKDNEIAQVKAEKADVESKLTKRINDLVMIVDQQKILVKANQTTTFETPDAIVSLANQREGFVYINVGSADNLRRQQTFSVFDRGSDGLIKSNPKGRIEVTAILGDHLAMCRIKEDKLPDIIVPGDLVFTPVWSPGQRIHLAITGLVDLTKNGRSDLALLKNLIQLNGGAVDEQVSVQTRYLIVGEDRGDSPDGKQTAAEKADYHDKIVAAQEIGVDQISVDRLLTLMGWRADVESAARNAKGDFQPAGAKPDEAKAKEATPFRPRTPPRGEGGAF